MKKRKLHVRNAALVGVITAANVVVWIATDYDDYEPRDLVPLLVTATATGTVMSDFSTWGLTGAPRSEEAAAVRPSYFGVVHDQRDDG